jgi:demethylmenaquinone methyltransferase/2-methoxy-6-polyprenyl-1,4-benzoquinol methylase
MFDRISGRYDLLNHLLSFGLDIQWRKRAVVCLDKAAGLRILDLACGTGDLAIAAWRNDRGCCLIGIDKAGAMLRLAQTKIADRHLAGSISLALGDGQSIPLVDSSIDAAMIAFGIRNMPDTDGCLREIHRSLKPGGQIIVLEFSRPGCRFVRTLHQFYLRRVVPLVGRLISGDSYAYSYLNQTIESYLQGEQFCQALFGAGFLRVKAQPITMGIVTIYTGRKN